MLFTKKVAGVDEKLLFLVMSGLSSSNYSLFTFDPNMLHISEQVLHNHMMLKASRRNRKISSPETHSDPVTENTRVSASHAAAEGGCLMRCLSLTHEHL